MQCKNGFKFTKGKFSLFAFFQLTVNRKTSAQIEEGLKKSEEAEKMWKEKFDSCQKKSEIRRHPAVRRTNS